jgi:hypothetical protein
MSSELPKDCLREVFKVITNSQADACYYPIPLTGHFINYRGSMINWCPIGRNANTHQREAFVKFDKENGFRESLRRSLETKLELLCPNKLTITLPQQTDYKNGWRYKL